MADWIFAFFHLGLILGVIGYAIVSLFQGNILRFAFILAGMVLYYFVVLHKPVKNELARRRSLKKDP